MRLLPLVSMAGLAAAILVGCAGPEPYGYGTSYPGAVAPYGSYPSQPYAAQPAAVVEYGRITSVQLVSPGATNYSNRSDGTAGTLIGGAVGGLLGNTVGHGGGRGAATVLGAVGGAVVGNNLDRSRGGTYTTSGPVYRLTVQTDAGLWRSYDVSAVGPLRVGDRVRVENGVVYLV